MKIYVASSWRNEQQQEVVKQLREAGHEVYDFKNPFSNTGFSWSDIDPNWQNWTNEEYFEALKHPVAEAGFKSDFDAMKWADVCVLVMPCGRSAHVEAGWMQGAGKPTIVLIENEAEPELMYKCFDAVVGDMEDVLAFCAYVKKEKLKVNKWKSLRKDKPEENNDLYDILLNNDLVVRDCNFIRKGIIFTQVDSLETYNFNEINSWRKSLLQQ